MGEIPGRSWIGVHSLASKTANSVQPVNAEIRALFDNLEDLDLDSMISAIPRALMQAPSATGGTYRRAGSAFLAIQPR